MKNRIMVIGNVGDDPDVRITNSGRKKVEINIATTNRYTNKGTGEEITETDWHRVEFWGKLGNIVESYVKKGALVMVEGMQKNISYETDEGERKTRSYIKADEVKMLTPKSKKNEY
jgi:single-strand DNA-binding protein